MGQSYNFPTKAVGVAIIIMRGVFDTATVDRNARDREWIPDKGAMKVVGAEKRVRKKGIEKRNCFLFQYLELSRGDWTRTSDLTPPRRVL